MVNHHRFSLDHYYVNCTFQNIGTTREGDFFKGRIDRESSIRLCSALIEWFGSDRRYKFFSSVLIIYFNPLILNISNLLKFEIRLNLINLIQKETEPGNRAICCHFVSWKINFISR